VKRNFRIYLVHQVNIQLVTSKSIDFFFVLSIDNHDKEIINVENEITRLHHLIEQRFRHLIENLESEKNNLCNKLDEYMQLNLK